MKIKFKSRIKKVFIWPKSFGIFSNKKNNNFPSKDLNSDLLKPGTSIETINFLSPVSLEKKAKRAIGLIYASCHQARSVLNISRKTIQTWCEKENFSNWYYISHKEYDLLMDNVVNKRNKTV